MLVPHEKRRVGGGEHITGYTPNDRFTPFSVGECSHHQYVGTELMRSREDAGTDRVAGVVDGVQRRRNTVLCQVAGTTATRLSLGCPGLRQNEIEACEEDRVREGTPLAQSLTNDGQEAARLRLRRTAHLNRLRRGAEGGTPPRGTGLM